MRGIKILLGLYHLIAWIPCSGTEIPLVLPHRNGRLQLSEELSGTPPDALIVNLVGDYLTLRVNHKTRPDG